MGTVDWSHLIAAWLVLAVAMGKLLRHGEPWILALGVALMCLLLARFWAPLLLVALVLGVALVLTTMLALLDFWRGVRGRH